jgi:hypothetical protein
MTGTGPYTHSFTIEDQSVHLYYQFYANDSTNNWQFEPIKSVPIYDNDGPVINALSETTPTEGTTGDEFIFGIDCTDNIKVENAYVWYKFGSSGSVNKMAMLKSGDTYTYTIDNLPDALDPLYYNFSFSDNSTIIGGPNWVSTTEKNIPITDNDKPEFDTDNSDTTAIANTTFTFSMTFTDNVETSTATVYYWYGTETTEQSLALASSGGNWDNSITIDNTLDPLHYYFNFTDTSGNWDVNAENQVTITDNEAPKMVTGSGNIETTTGESFEIFAKFTDNIGLDTVTLYYAKETTSTFLNKEVSATGTSKYLATNTLLNINTTKDTVGWKYYFEAKDTSLNSIGYGSKSSPHTITVTDNDKPTADAGIDQSVKVGATVAFDASASEDNIGISTYTWSFDYSQEPKVLTGKTQSFKFDKAGSYEVTLKVVDAAGLSDTDTMTVVVTEDIVPPVIVLENPKDGATISDDFITLSWSTTHQNYEYVTYHLYFGESSDPPKETEIDHEDPTNKVVEYQLDNLEDGKTYYWAVVGEISGTEGPKSEIRSFTVNLGDIVYDVEITSDKSSLQITAGTSESVTLTVKNTGTTVDLFDLTIDKGSFPEDVTLEFVEVQITAQQSKDVKLTFTTTDTAAAGTYMIKVTATSRSATETEISSMVEISVEILAMGEDTDNDNLPDSWEELYWGDITKYDGDDDPDNDGKTNKQEYAAGTDPTKKDVDPTDDTDSDGLPDTWEMDNFGTLDYGANDDPDDDGKTNLQEYNAGTDPNKKASETEDDGDMTMVIVIVVVVIVVVVLVLLFMMMKGKGGKKEPETKEPEQPSTSTPARAPGMPPAQPGPKGPAPAPSPSPSPTPAPSPGGPSIQQLKAQTGTQQQGTPQTQPQVPGQKPPNAGGQ